MSVLEFIAALKWPIVVLLLVGFAGWRFRRNPTLGEQVKKLIAGRIIRLSAGGVGFELGEDVADAAVIATRTDNELAETSRADADSQPDVAQIRRDAVETLMVTTAH